MSTADKSTSDAWTRASRRAHYLANLEDERCKARERAQRNRNQESADARARRLARHREAQARYREKNRTRLRMASWQYRKEKAFLRAREADEAQLHVEMSADFTSLEPEA